MNDLITNGTEIKQRILSEISNAKQSIYIAMAWFTDRDIAAAIIEAKKRNIVIDIILSSNVQNETVKVMFKDAGISVHAFETGDTRGIMHHKFCLLDNRISINGSYNFSYNASSNNVENIIISDDTKIYNQFFSEFERLKYNIDHNIDVNVTASPLLETNVQKIQPLNMLDNFSKQIHNLVYSSAEINTEEYQKKGYEKSKESNGNIDIFRTEFGNIKEIIKTFTTDEGLTSKKNILKSNIHNLFESTKSNLDDERQSKEIDSRRDNELEKRQITDNTTELRDAKNLFEQGNRDTGEIGLLQINKEIDRNNLERRGLEQSFIVKKFWSTGTIFITILLTIFGCYLSVFFASAFYKMLFESDMIRISMENGLNPGVPKLVDGNAIIKLFQQQGSIFGFIGIIFFLFPILLSNIKLLGSEKKAVNNLLFWVGLIIFDVIVAGMIAINTDEMKSLLVGTKSELEIWEVIKKGEFWMIFMFGMVPLIITHYLIENIYKAYRSSKREMVDAEKHRLIQILDGDLIELNAKKESLVKKIESKDDAIKENNTRILNLEVHINTLLSQIADKYSEYQKQIKAIFDDFNAKVMSGKIFTDVIFDSVIAAYKSGFVEYLPEFYSSPEVTSRVREIEQIISSQEKLMV